MQLVSLGNVRRDAENAVLTNYYSCLTDFKSHLSIVSYAPIIESKPNNKLNVNTTMRMYIDMTVSIRQNCSVQNLDKLMGFKIGQTAIICLNWNNTCITKLGLSNHNLAMGNGRCHVIFKRNNRTCTFLLKSLISSSNVPFFQVFGNFILNHIIEKKTSMHKVIKWWVQTIWSSCVFYVNLY